MHAVFIFCHEILFMGLACASLLEAPDMGCSVDPICASEDESEEGVPNLHSKNTHFLCDFLLMRVASVTNWIEFQAACCSSLCSTLLASMISHDNQQI